MILISQSGRPTAAAVDAAPMRKYDLYCYEKEALQDARYPVGGK